MSKDNQSFSCRGLQPLKEGDMIYGRDFEIKELSNRIQENLHTILYGQSGAGKSSVIEAGVFPLLRQNKYFPIVIRFLEIGPTDYMEYVINQVKAVASKSDCFKESYAVIPQVNINEEGLSELLAFFQGNTFVNKKGEQYTPVLVFDQFEEVLNNPDTYERGEIFIKDIYPLIDDSYCLTEGYLTYSNYRILFSIREDFLYALEDIIDKHKLSELKQNRIRLRFLDTDCAVPVVSKILLDTSYDISDNTHIERLAQMIVAESKNTSYSFGVSTPILSIICYQIIKSDLRIQDIDESTISALIYNFYSDAVSDVSYRSRKFLEEKLITKDGRRASVDLKDAEADGSLSLYEIDKLVNETRLLSIINIGNTRRLEFSHDIVVRIINRKKTTFFRCVKNVLKRPFQFNGYASREDFVSYWSCWLLIFSLYGIIVTSPTYKSTVVHNFLYYSFLIPAISVTVRRMHSVGKSGWWTLVPILPIIWAHRQDSVRPYRGGVSNVDMFEFWKDWKTPPIRKIINRTTYVGHHLCFLYLSLLVVFILSYLLLMIVPEEELMQAYIMVPENIYWPPALYYDMMAVDTFTEGWFHVPIIIVLMSAFFGWTMGLLAMRLPRMGFRRFWAFIPVISLFFWIYGFWSDSYFDKRKTAINKASDQNQ